MLHYFIVLNTIKSHLLECVEMQNYKVEVQNHSEAMEAQDLFLKMGFRKELFSYSGYPKLVITDIDSIGGYSSGAEIGYLDADKITLQELRAMVSVQKYEELAKKYDGVKTKQLPNGVQFKKDKTSVTIYPSTGTIVSDVNGKINVLRKAGIGKLDHEMNKHFSVITPKQKEYLVKTDTGYVLQVISDFVDGNNGIIEVPEGSNIAWKDNSNGFVFFTKMEMGYRDATVIWQRESLNDQVASAEEYRQSFAHTPKATLDLINNIQNAFNEAQSAINAQNAMAKLFAYPQYISGVAHGKEFIVKPNQKSGGADHGVEQAQTRELSECDLIDSGKLIIGGLGESFPVGLLHHGFSGFTQPEELPFIDDEPKLRNIKIRVNGNLDKAIETIQSMGYWNCQFNRIPSDCYWLVGNSDATVDYGSEQHMYIDHHVEYFVEDELKGVDATLAEREAQYGSFIGVANTTGQLMSVLLNSKNGHTLPYAHQEALHMICSKMARIVNGDHNHLDSWHDIGGYAKLIENNIK